MDAVVDALTRPSSWVDAPLPAWDGLIRAARRADLLARLAATFEAAGLMPSVPPQPRTHLESALLLARAQAAAVRREVEALLQALSPLKIPVVLLKGAAYVLADSAAARGRLFSDVDILVPADALPSVEAALMAHGWASLHPHPYDQHYYRQWMHELPPMQHVARQSVVDVHHAILPRTARLHVDTALLMVNSVVVEAESPQLRVLAPIDRVLHSATHLFCNEEMSHGLRDLSDLDVMLREGATRASFWPSLIQRADELGLGPMLLNAVRYAHHVFGTPVPVRLLDEAHVPAGIRQRLLDKLWLTVLATPAPPDAESMAQRFARWVVLLRAHWLRMPLPLLVRHAAIKAWRQWQERLQPARP